VPVRSVLITGAASGQGRATAARLARAGFGVTAIDRDAGGLGTLADELGDYALATYCTDVTDFAAISEIVDQITANGAGLDALLACAAIHGDYDPMASGDPVRWENLLRVNVIGVENCVRACLPHFLRRENGSIVIWGSVAALTPLKSQATYAATKAAITHLANCLRYEVAGSGVKVSLIHPGITQTPMMTSSESAVRTLAALKMTPLAADDIARCVQFMLEQPDECAISEMIVRPTRQVY
jgi:NADP-dependent 3-hydroxy acid dehydrogenase YdfG